MSGKFVFPGGRLDYIDQRINVPTELAPPVMERLKKEVSVKVSHAKLKGLALAAIRETFEETGLVVGRPTSARVNTSHSSWRDYFGHAVLPPLEEMDFIARAITPPYRTRRFDTRFFMVHGDTLHSDPSQVSSASGELLDLHWLTLDEARQTDLHQSHMLRRDCGKSDIQAPLLEGAMEEVLLEKWQLSSLLEQFPLQCSLLDTS